MTTHHDTDAWPIADLDPIRRLHVLAASIPALHVVERTMPLPLKDVWMVASDLEQTLPAIGPGFVTSLRVLDRQGDRLVADVRGPFGIRDEFQITLRDGWCWMEGRLLGAAMAAVPENEGTRFAWATVMKVPGGQWLAPISELTLRRTLKHLETRVRMATVQT